VGLASSRYFASRTSGQVVSRYATSFGPRHPPATARWQQPREFPQLPTAIDFFAPAGPLQTPYANGFKLGEFRVQTETNVGGKTFPLVYTYEQFRPQLKNGVSSNDLVQQFLVTVKVQSVHLTSVPDILPPATKGKTRIFESRFPNLPATRSPIAYSSSATRLPETPEPAAVSQYHMEMAFQHRLAAHTAEAQAAQMTPANNPGALP